MATTKKNTDLATVETTPFDIVPFDGEVLEALHEELDGLGSIPFDQVKIPAGGARSFEVPSGDPDNPDTALELVGIIVDHHPSNCYWKDPYAGGGNASPDCYSMDGKTGLEAETGCVKNCETCPFNQFGSADDGNGKACKNTHRLYLLREGETLPIVLTLPPTSIKPFKEYIAKRVLLAKPPKRCWQVVTKITLKTEQNAAGIKYSKAVFAKVGILENEAAVKPTVDGIKALIQAQKTTFDAAPSEVAEAAPAAPTFEAVKEDEDLPF